MTIIQSGIRIAATVAESIASVINAAANAMAAMASIPYVGPILAIAAMAAVLGAGMALVKTIGKKDGGYTASGNPNEESGEVTHKGEWTAPAWMVSDPRYGIHDLEKARTGALSLSQLHDHTRGSLNNRSIVRSTSNGGAGGQRQGSSGGGGNHQTNVMLVDDRQSEIQALRRNAGQNTVVNIIKRNRASLFDR
jgi:hypothetical protein